MTDLEKSTEETGESDARMSARSNTLSRHYRLWSLFAAHAVLGPLVCIWLAAQESKSTLQASLLIVLMGACLLAQASLLGFWAVFSPMRWRNRLLGLFIGISYLAFWVTIGSGKVVAVLLIVVPLVGAIAAFGLLRWRYAELHFFPRQALGSAQRGRHFTIRGVMFLTFVVAATIVAARLFREGDSEDSMLLFSSALTLYFVVIGLSSVWAGLGSAPPVLRSAFVILASAVLGAIYLYSPGDEYMPPFWYSMAIIVLEAGVFVASLLVIRSCGFRMVRKPSSEIQPFS